MNPFKTCGNCKYFIKENYYEYSRCDIYRKLVDEHFNICEDFEGPAYYNSNGNGFYHD